MQQKMYTKQRHHLAKMGKITINVHQGNREGMNWIHQAQDKDKFCDLVIMLLNIQEFIGNMSIWSLHHGINTFGWKGLTW